jgi:hypothetical protein
LFCITPAQIEKAAERNPEKGKTTHHASIKKKKPNEEEQDESDVEK